MTGMTCWMMDANLFRSQTTKMLLQELMSVGARNKELLRELYSVLDPACGSGGLLEAMRANFYASVSQEIDLDLVPSSQRRRVFSRRVGRKVWAKFRQFITRNAGALRRGFDFRYQIKLDGNGVVTDIKFRLVHTRRALIEALMTARMRAGVLLRQAEQLWLSILSTIGSLVEYDPEHGFLDQRLPVMNHAGRSLAI